MKAISSKRVLLWLVVLTLRAAAVAQQIQISNVEELYSAVNNSANAGATLVLAPGTYGLSASGPNGARPKGGRIELQPDMSLIGVEGDRDAVVIDAVNLPKASFPSGTTGPNAAVRMGLGHNALEWLTVRGAVNAQANIDARLQLQPLETTYILLAHIASSGGVRGMNLINYGDQASNRIIEADIVDSYFFDNVSGAGEGIRVGNFASAQKSAVNLRMDGNLSWGQPTGRIIENSGSFNTTVDVVDSGNRFYSNSAGTIIFGAVAGGLGAAFPRTDGNIINFEAHGDQFLDNTGSPGMDHGGLVVRGTENVTPDNSAGGGSNNTVNVALWGCRMLDNTGSDLYAVGARTQFVSTASSTQNNHVTIQIQGAGNGNGKWQPVEFFANSLPGSPTPDYGNWVKVID